MSERANAVAVPETIQTYAQGLAQESITSLADFIAPTVEVSSVTGYYKKYTEKHRFKTPATRRAIGGRATELAFDVSDAKFSVEPYALDVPLDKFVTEADDMENTLQEAIEMGVESGTLDHELEVIDAVNNSLTEEAFAVGANDDFVDKLDEKIMLVLKAAAMGSMMQPRIVWGANAWRKYKNHASVKNRIGPKTAKGVSVTINDTADLQLARPESRECYNVKDTAPEGKPRNLEFVLDTQILIFAAKSNPTRRDPSFMKTFRKRGSFISPRVYQRDDGRVEVAALDWSHEVQTTNTEAAILLDLQ